MGVIVLFVLIAAIAAAVFSFGRVRTAGATAQVFVDDLVVGRGPGVCAITGVPTSNRVEVHSTEGGFQGWWLLLIFLGPIGWVGIALLAGLARKPGRVSGIVAMSPEAVIRYNRMVGTSTRALGLGLALLVAGGIGLSVLRPSTPTLAIALAVIVGLAILTGLVASIIAPFRWIEMRLDGSGRWVTIERVHPAFTEAMYAQNLEMSHNR